MAEPLDRRLFVGHKGPYQPEEPARPAFPVEHPPLRQPASAPAPAPAPAPKVTKGGIDTLFNMPTGVDEYAKHVSKYKAKVYPTLTPEEVQQTLKEAEANGVDISVHENRYAVLRRARQNKHPSIPKRDIATGERTDLDKSPPTKKEETKIIADVAKDISTSNQRRTIGGIAELSSPDITKYRTENTTNLKQFAKDLGVDLGDPYDAWAYIRDMSAGLLASDSNTFLGALGDAALLSNKNRQTMEAAQKELKAKLVMAKWKNDEDWAKLHYKTAAELATAKNKRGSAFKKLPGGSYSDIGLNGEKISWTPIEMTPEGVNAAQAMPTGTWEWKGDQLYVQDVDRKTYDKLLAERTRIEEGYNWGGQKLDKTENVKAMIDNQLFKTTAGGEYLLSIRNNPEVQELIADLMGQYGKGMEEFGEYYLNSAEPEGAEVARMLTQVPQIIQGLRSVMTKGPLSNMHDADYKEIADRIQTLYNRGVEEAAVKGSLLTPIKYNEIFKTALKNTVRDIKVYQKDRGFKFAWGVSESDLKEAAEASEDIRGIGWFNLKDTPPNYNKQIEMFQRSDERPLINKDQIELLPKEQVPEVYGDMGKIREEMLRHGFDRDRAKWDINLSYDTSGLIFGGEDRFNLFSKKDLDSRYVKPPQFYLEPLTFSKNGQEYPTSKLRDQDIHFNIFTGKYYRYDENGYRKDIIPENDPSVKIDKPRRMKLER